MKETEDKLDKADLAQKGMAAKLQAALDAEGDARRREQKATEECRKQEELALKLKGQLADAQRQLDESGRQASGDAGSRAKNDETQEKQIREIAGLKVRRKENGLV